MTPPSITPSPLHDVDHLLRCSTQQLDIAAQGLVEQHVALRLDPERVPPELLRRQDLRRFDVILSCSQPHANHLLGMDLKRRTGLPWVAYFCDPWSDNPYAQFPSERVVRHNRMLEERVLGSADLVLYTSEEMLRLARDKHPVLATKRTGVLPHAIVPEWYGTAASDGGASVQEPVRILHNGHFYRARRVQYVELAV